MPNRHLEISRSRPRRSSGGRPLRHARSQSVESGELSSSSSSLSARRASSDSTDTDSDPVTEHSHSHAHPLVKMLKKAAARERDAHPHSQRARARAAPSKHLRHAGQRAPVTSSHARALAPHAHAGASTDALGTCSSEQIAVALATAAALAFPSTHADIKPEDIPPVPPNKFLFRGPPVEDVDKPAEGEEGSAAVDGARESRSTDRTHREQPFFSFSGRKIKGRGNFV